MFVTPERGNLLPPRRQERSVTKKACHPERMRAILERFSAGVYPELAEGVEMTILPFEAFASLREVFRNAVAALPRCASVVYTFS